MFQNYNYRLVKKLKLWIIKYEYTIICLLCTPPLTINALMHPYLHKVEQF